MDKHYLLIEKVKEIAQKLENCSDLIDYDIMNPFFFNAKSLEENIASAVEEGRNLRIGIVGAVKAGKSSFLNALVFDGEDVLPKAATPMTAALTKISYAEKETARVVFYSKGDWQGILSKADAYQQEVQRQTEAKRKRLEETGIRKPGQKLLNFDLEKIEQQVKNDLSSTEIAGCNELVQMAENLSVSTYLDKDVEIPFSELNNYAGSGGQFTPIVKHIEVFLNAPDLNGLEIIDTPGLNDPIVSRTILTNRYLSKCDVVFLLSYSGQFLTSEDMALLQKNLPSDGVRNIFIIGSKFDSVLCDNLKKADRFTFKQICGLTIKNLTAQAETNLNKASLSVNEDMREILQRTCRQTLYFTAAIMFNIGKKITDKRPLSMEEKKLISNLSTFNGFSGNDAKFLRDFSGIDNIKEKPLLSVREDKESIIEEKISHLLGDNINKFLGILENMNIAARNNQYVLQTADMDALNEKLKNYMRALNSVRSEVKRILELEAIRAQKDIKDLQLNIEEGTDNHFNIDTTTRTQKVYSYSTTEKHGFWPWSKKEEIRHYDNVTSYYASVSEAVKNLNRYARESKRSISEEVDRLFEINVLKRKLKEVILSSFDTSDRNFDENDVIIPVEILLAKLTVPNINLDTEIYENMIAAEFSGSEVEGSNISRLEQVQDRTITKMCRGFCDELNNLMEKVEKDLLNASATLVDGIESKLKGDIERVKTQISNREEALNRYEKFIEMISDFKQEITRLY